MREDVCGSRTLTKNIIRKSLTLCWENFLVIELEHLGETSMVIRYDLQSLYGAYCSSGWDAVFENVEDKLNMCKSGQGKNKTYCKL